MTHIDDKRIEGLTMRAELAEKALAEASKILSQRFSRSAPIEEELIKIGMGKRELPSREECLAWGVKLGKAVEEPKAAPGAPEAVLVHGAYSEKPPAGYDTVFAPATLKVMENSCSTPASRAGIECRCRSGTVLEICKNQPQCNLKAAP